MSLELDKIYCCNSLNLMAQMPDGFVDLTVTSPPYDKLRKYNGFSFDFKNIARELYRVTKQGGVVVWVVGDSTTNGSETGNSFRQALHFIQTGFNLHDTMIYAKNNYVPLTHNRYEQQFEYMFILSKGKLNTFNPIMIPCIHAGHNSTGRFRHTGSELMEANKPGKIGDEKIKPNIWFYNVGRDRSTKDKVAHKHPAIFPEQLAADHILSWSNPGDLVFDPFIGSGTTAKMAKLLNRRFIGAEISQEYVDIANERISNVKPNS